MIRQTRKQDGFTLVEVLVSLAIFSLAIVGLNRAATLAVSGTATLQLRTHAGFVADNAVVLTRIAPLDLGTERSQVDSGGMAFDVVVETSATDQTGFYEIAVRVTERDQDRIVSERLAFRYVQSVIVATPDQDNGETSE